jgi:predicted RND superfamily exporter protein
MLTSFYRFYPRHLLVAAALVFPWLFIQSEQISCNNNLETWLPEHSEVRRAYRDFTEQFGAEELVIIGLVDRSPDDPLIEALASRIERVPGIRQCWTADRLARVMEELGVPREEAFSRLRGLAISRDDRLTGLVALLTPEGIYDRSKTVAALRTELEYCQIGGDDLLLTGAPIIIAEMDRLGGLQANRFFFLCTFVVSAGLLLYVLRDVRLASGIVAITLWAVVATNCVVQLLGGEMNFILSVLPVMVLIFTLSVAVHFVHYYRLSLGEKRPIDAAMRHAWWPCFWATFTTVIGLLSLLVSDIGPVRQFGWAASVGAVVSMVAALGFTPALVVLAGAKSMKVHHPGARLQSLSALLVRRPARIVVAVLILLVVAGSGLARLQSHIDPVEFLPRGSRVVDDLIRVEDELSPAESIEGVIDFGVAETPFVEKLQQVREIEAQVRAVHGVTHTLSLASFFPVELPSGTFQALELLGKASARAQDGDFISTGERYWRVSARVKGTPTEKYEVYRRLKQLPTVAPVHFTGIAPLIVDAQRDIFNGFWESFASAFGVITLIMVVSFRSMKLALVAMLPNVAPIGIVFGLLGWFNVPVDIGMMMTASIALGIAVDATFHFVMTYRELLPAAESATAASREAFLRTSVPIFEASVVACVGMLVLTLSPFTPTVHFGGLMSMLLAVAVIGDLVLLPALMALPGSLRRFSANRAPGDPAGELNSRATADAALEQLPRQRAA